MRVLPKVDRFYYILVAVLAALSLLVVFTFKGIFSSIISAYGVEQEVNEAELRVDRTKLDNAYKAVFEKGIIPLEIAR